MESQQKEINVTNISPKISGFNSSLFWIIKFTLFSIIIVHIFGIFGVFIALAYPLLWLILPNKVFCLICLHRALLHKDHPYCPVCKRQVETIYNPPLRSVFVNVLILLITSLLFTGLILVELSLIKNSKIDLSSIFSASSAQPEFVVPDQQTYKVGSSFYFDIEVTKLDKPINVVKSILSFSNDLFTIKQIDTSQSFATIFTKKDYSNNDGTISIIGGLPNPGFIGDNGLFARVYFEAKKPGIGQIIIQKGSSIRANDGNGTNIINDVKTVPIIIEP